jgi:hypothetical protein
MANPFETINDILFAKEPMINPENGYNAFMVNRGLSYQHDCLGIAEQMNLSSWLDSDLQYYFLFYSVDKKPKHKRKFTKWGKAEDDTDIQLIQQVYGVSYKIALEYLSLLNKEKLQQLKDSLYKGGFDGKS